MADRSMEGLEAPDFRLKDQHGKTNQLSKSRGKTVVLYFYPKDETPGCTQEACAFRDAYDRFTAKDVVVMGISPDPVESHAAFAARHALPFPLLADPDHDVAEAYGVWQEKNMYGKRFFGVTRSTFIIGPEGTIDRVFGRVRVDGHVEQVLKALDVLHGRS